MCKYGNLAPGVKFVELNTARRLAFVGTVNTHVPLVKIFTLSMDDPNVTVKRDSGLEPADVARARMVTGAVVDALSKIGGNVVWLIVVA